jgi:N-acetylglucosamine kinase
MSDTAFIAAGIDLGGTKIEAQVFGAGWTLAERRRIDTPSDYDGLIRALAGMAAWTSSVAGRDLPLGLAAAGLINPASGLALASNVPTSGRPLPVDLNRASGRAITFINDCRAFTLSEAVLGAGRGHALVVGLILGTGVGGGAALNGRLLPEHVSAGGEFGHFPLPAALVADHGLPVVDCGCGRRGCSETLIAGPGLARLAKAMTGRELTAPEIAAGRFRDADLGRVWAMWCKLTAELIVTISFTLDPSVIVLGGGLSRIDGLIPDLDAALEKAVFRDFPRPALRLAEGGDASGARGAALEAFGRV